MTWTPPVHKMLCPVMHGDTLLEEITLKTFSTGEHAAALAKAGKDEDDRYEALAQLATGLPAEVIDTFRRPDYVSVSEWINKWVWSTSDEILEVVRRDDDGNEIEERAHDGYVVPLLVPITIVTGETVAEVTLRLPELRATKAMKQQKNDRDKARFITAHCTGLMLPDVQLLSCPDWNRLQVLVGHFLNKPAAFFQSVTSK
ncbi:phage tail assembly protein [uncultured Pseudomonas sp.]|uniref:phage tail assembly protein n=1 Tax=uncultured Pseudomonas sp. TaxID=114707 RepID=UPI00262A41EA|nr:phage tail assembly protein [uncultured Pseudomonas sp.]